MNILFQIGCECAVIVCGARCSVYISLFPDSLVFHVYFGRYHPNHGFETIRYLFIHTNCTHCLFFEEPVRKHGKYVKAVIIRFEYICFFSEFLFFHGHFVRYHSNHGF